MATDDMASEVRLTRTPVLRIGNVAFRGPRRPGEELPLLDVTNIPRAENAYECVLVGLHENSSVHAVWRLLGHTEN